MATYSRPGTNYANFRPKVYCLGDSTTDGVGAANVAAYRTSMYLAARAAGTPIYWIGTQNNPGPDNQLTVDPWHEGIDGITLELLTTNILQRIGTCVYSPPDIVTLVCGTNSLDPAVGNKTPAQVAATLSTTLDAIWAFAWKPTFQIIVYQVFPRLDAVDTAVQAYNALIPSVVAAKSYSANITVGNNYGAVAKDPSNYESSPDVSLVHFNDAGYNAMGTGGTGNMWSTLQQVRLRAAG